MSNSSRKCLVSREHVLKLIDAIVYTLASSHYARVAELDYDEHYRQLVSNQVEAAIALAEEVGFDLWEQTAVPVCRDDTPIAVLLREAEDRFGMPTRCPMPGCGADIVRCCIRPRGLPTGTRWPSLPELCTTHTAVRLDLLQRRVKRGAVRHAGPIHTAGMPMPAVAHLALTPDELRLAAAS